MIHKKAYGFFLAFFIWAVLFSAVPMAARADIYMYKDEKGVFHFTNVPASRKYRLYQREGRKSRGLSRGLSYYLPSTYDKIIKKAALRHHLEIPLIKAVIKVESDFNPYAVSNKGAMGLMQIMPENFDLLDITDPFNPEENIMGGARYLRMMLDRFKGHTSQSLAAYNAGPTSVDKHNGIPPFAETKTYVNRVWRYYHLFNKQGKP